jgi:hypothetical protein
VPTSLSGESRAETRHAFYLDTGPLFLVFAGLLDADDPLMTSSLLWFRQGPQRRLYRYDSQCLQVPSLQHEMSSCEPIYSFNLFHSHQAGDREKFLEGLYSLLAGGISRKTFISCETRGGQAGNLFTASLALPLMRLAVIDDWVKDGELHLLRLVPLAWLSPERQTVWENAPTEFGPVDLRFGLSRDGKTLSVKFNPRFRGAPRRILLHVPPVEHLVKVTFNGSPVSWDRRNRLAVVG